MRGGALASASSRTPQRGLRAGTDSSLVPRRRQGREAPHPLEVTPRPAALAADVHVPRAWPHRDHLHGRRGWAEEGKQLSRWIAQAMPAGHPCVYNHLHVTKRIAVDRFRPVKRERTSTSAGQIQGENEISRRPKLPRRSGPPRERTHSFVTVTALDTRLPALSWTAVAPLTRQRQAQRTVPDRIQAEEASMGVH